MSSSFVAREAELAQLNGHLAAALAGQGRVVFVTGDAVSGKTALMNEFARRAMASHADLLAAIGNCSAQADIGDPYLPFVDLLQLLTGDIEAKRAGGTISPEHARRLWDAMPQALEILTERGPELIGRFVLGAALVLRAEEGGYPQGSWRQRSAALVERATVPDRERPQLPTQVRLFDQVTDVLTTLARLHPLLLILDDLQWADTGTTSLLFHLGRRLKGSRILIVGAYRPGDIAARRVMLAQLDAFLDREPNRLDTQFRDAFDRRTDGHALCTIELLRGLQERGDLVQDEAGRWIEGATLNWDCMPARVEAVVAERIERLSPQSQALLAAASVEGEEFTAEALAHAMKLDEPPVIQQLSGPLCKRERLVCAHSLRRLRGVSPISSRPCCCKPITAWRSGSARNRLRSENGCSNWRNRPGSHSTLSWHIVRPSPHAPSSSRMRAVSSPKTLEPAVTMTTLSWIKCYTDYLS